MNEKLETYARQDLKHNLAKCTDDEQLLFARMYGGFGYNDDINTVVAGMDVDKLDWAMQQVDRTLAEKVKI